ncbi:MAG: hypothetical protein KDE22_04500 [Rhodobacterales bacterium]|nr:hypothetical protein [Rhodobacterales bacterium]
MHARRLTLVPDRQENLDLSRTLHIAFASTDHKCVNQHFGSASCFVVHAVSAQAAHFVSVIEFSPSPRDGDEGKLAGRIAALRGCDAVYVQAVGSSAATQLLQAGIFPQKAPAGAPIPLLIGDLQNRMVRNTPAWLAQALACKRTADRFDTMEEEGWDE